MATSTIAPPGSPAAVRLPYLDGLRAVAALYVVAFHAVLGFGADLTGAVASASAQFGVWARGGGHLHRALRLLPHVARGQVPGWAAFPGLSAILHVVAFRILPPYFATLALSLLLIYFIPALRQADTGTIWDESLPALEPGAILSHLLLVHIGFPAGPSNQRAALERGHGVADILLLPAAAAASLAALRRSRNAAASVLGRLRATARCAE
jgi:peptidoglycan/LPS O-acetylase OafA/YrhL